MWWNDCNDCIDKHFEIISRIGMDRWKRKKKWIVPAFTSPKSLANRIKIKYLKYFSIMFVMHIKQFPQFIPSYKRKYALKAIQLNFVELVFFLSLFFLSLSLSLRVSAACCLSVFVPHFLHQASFFRSVFRLVAFLNHCRWGNNMRKGKGNGIVGRLLT